MKELGQHFLQDEEIAAEIVASMGLRWEERALEIGPGRGILLRFLLKASHRVTAVELDRRLQKSLEKTFAGHPGLELVFDDVMKFDLMNYLISELTPVKLVGNIPYSLSGPILFHIFGVVERLQESGEVVLKSATLMLQKEVAERLCAEPGGRIYGGLTVFRSLVADARLLFDVPGEAFFPPPKVTSSVIRLEFFPAVRFQIKDRFLFQQFIHHVFAQRRKMLKNSLASLRWMCEDKAQVDHAQKRIGLPDDFDFTRRPEELSVEDFIRLFHLIAP